MPSTIESPSEVLTMDLEQLYNEICLLKQQGEITEEEYDKCENGIKIRFPIYYITQGWYELYPQSKKAKITGHSKISLKNFMDEKQERETLMRKLIVETIEQDPTEPRV